VFDLVIPLAVVALIVVAIARGRSSNDDDLAAGARSAARRSSGPLRRQLDQWREQGLIDEATATSIWDYEVARMPAASRLPMAAEAVGYVGAALVIAAAAIFVGRRWDDLVVSGRILVLLVPALGAAFAGWRVGLVRDRAFERMGSVLWVLATAALAGALTVVFVDVVHDGDAPEHGGLLFVAGIAGVWAVTAYLWRRLPLQLLVVFLATLLSALGVVNAIEPRGDGYSSIVWGAVVMIVGVAWLAVGIDGRVVPSEVGRFLGPVTLLVGGQVVRPEAETLSLWLGLAAAATIMAVGVWRADVLVLLVGTAGLFQWAPQVAVYYLADAIGIEATLIVVGVLLLFTAAVFVRLYRRMHRKQVFVLGATPEPSAESLEHST
jgi:uncharacterized membrane protein